MPARKNIRKILIIGSGPIVIGQACEFDYSGTQAVKALQEEGCSVVLVNPNPATVMTTPGVADAVYMEPLSSEYMEEVIRREAPDALLPTMGGQTGLNTALRLDQEKILEKYGVEVIGASIKSIQLAEDRGRFKEVIEKIGMENPRSALVDNLKDAEAFAGSNGFPVIIRPSYTLGGQGGGISYGPADFNALVSSALEESPVHQVLIEESLLGWKEFEMEVMRDHADNAVIICSIENIDSMGIHTGDSITVAPIQTLSDTEYQEMRTASLEILRAVGVDCGGSNVQFAVHPETGRRVVIEMNPRVSRSSALASKATGFPIARCAAKLAIGYTLDEIINDITGKTVSCFEPALDYCAVKVPRFELEKFPLAYNELGTQMKSIGESLALGRTFSEALNKAVRAADFGFDGLEELQVGDDKLETILSSLHPRRLFAVYSLLKREGEKAIPEIHRRTRYDTWFLHEINRLAELENHIRDTAEEKKEIPDSLILEAKRAGLSDRRISKLTGLDEKDVLLSRRDKKISSAYHFVDTCAGEFSADTPYFYSTYGEIDEGEPLDDKSVIILSSGPNRIGQGLEFDTCCTLASIAYRKLGGKSILVNSNPETVSTDFNVSDRLYMEPLTTEHVAEILYKENTKRVVVQLGGQTPLNMAGELMAHGAEIVGTSLRSIEAMEDRGLFARMVHKLGLLQPKNRMAADKLEVLKPRKR